MTARHVFVLAGALTLTSKDDPVAAARQLEGSGFDVTLNIVGFTLKGKQVRHS